MSKKKTATKKSTAPAPAKGKLGSSSPLDVDLLEQIVKLMGANDLNTVDVRDGEKRVILKRGAVAPVVTYTTSSHAPAPTGPAASAAAPAASTAKATPAADDESNLIAIKSPMVGTFYSAPSPDSKPFVSVGSAISDDTEVCVIEAMKNFMPIKAETRGTVAKILVTNGQTVEFGQKLFLIKP